MPTFTFSLLHLLYRLNHISTLHTLHSTKQCRSEKAKGEIRKHTVHDANIKFLIQTLEFSFVEYTHIFNRKGHNSPYSL